MRGHDILMRAAERASPELAVEMLCEAANACFYAGNPGEMVAAAERARAQLTEHASIRTRFLAAVAFGMASIVGGDAAAGTDSIHQAIALAEGSSELQTEVACFHGWQSDRSSCAKPIQAGGWLSAR